MKTDRSYYELAEVGSSTEFDYLRSKMSEFQSYMNRPESYITFSSDYVGRLELLSYRVYGDVNLWWVIALVNDIIDPFDDSLIDTMIKIPDILDVYDFYDDNYIPTSGVA